MVNAGTHTSIRTPDQRIRVFVSSTLRELADERRAVRSAIEQLQLAPVMFELGARPHAPRDLYRSYLAQSDVFVGIYGESYGWVADGESVSGLEDEYNLSGDRPLHVALSSVTPSMRNCAAGFFATAAQPLRLRRIEIERPCAPKPSALASASAAGPS